MTFATLSIVNFLAAVGFLLIAGMCVQEKKDSQIVIALFFAILGFANSAAFWGVFG